jgi:hypothetical protein
MNKSFRYPKAFSLFVPLSLLAFVVSTTTACGRAQMPDDQTQEEVVETPSATDIEAAAYIDSLGFEEVSHERMVASSARDQYSYVDPKGLVPAKLLSAALAYYQQNISKIANKKYLSVVDFSAYSGQSRFYIIDMNSGAVTPYHVAHGSGSDPGNDGFAEKFSNVSGSKASSLGFYLTAETYNGKHGLSLRMDGLSSTNSNVRSRAIVIHGASYVSDSNVRPGRSWGCLAVSMANRDKVVKMLKGGSLIYAGLAK